MLFVAGGGNGLMIHDNGNVSIGWQGGETHKLHVEGSLHAGNIEASSLSLTGSTNQTGYHGYHNGSLKNTDTIDVPDNKVVVGISFKRYRKSSGDSDTYTFALRYK